MAAPAAPLIDRSEFVFQRPRLPDDRPHSGQSGDPSRSPEESRLVPQSVHLSPGFPLAIDASPQAFGPVVQSDPTHQSREFRGSGSTPDAFPAVDWRSGAGKHRRRLVALALLSDPHPNSNLARPASLPAAGRLARIEETQRRSQKSRPVVAVQLHRHHRHGA